MEGQLFAFTNPATDVVSRKTKGLLESDKKMSWDLTFAKRNLFVMY